ncbi:SCO family protein [Guptibacillus hwajinpoensis]|uniref:Protein SCO1/2 n=1 Tax=Guptibacillus hwajinpoensis TaxID=208199 RepID=A0ABU0K626_9BACL|nr:SCO family protein [Alkalihalobacillus hemicentroti]MDQ0484817.1 protein SCO1/2 [Alkalihalobacillus hemicentroti]
MRKMIYLFLFLIGFCLVYFFWPHDELPVIKKVNSFELISTEEETYQLDNSKVKIISFFYTNCPDICPLTLSDMKELQTTLKEEGLFETEVELVAITLDPEVDDLAKIKEYALLYDADVQGWKWLSGSKEKIEEVTTTFNMVAKKMDDGFVTHSTNMYLVDGKQQIRGIYDMATIKQNVDNDKIMEDVHALLQE